MVKSAGKIFESLENHYIFYFVYIKVSYWPLTFENWYPRLKNGPDFDDL